MGRENAGGAWDWRDAYPGCQCQQSLGSAVGFGCGDDGGRRGDEYAVDDAVGGLNGDCAQRTSPWDPPLRGLDYRQCSLAAGGTPSG